MVICLECGKDGFANEHGLKVHIGRQHKNLMNQIELPRNARPDPPNPPHPPDPPPSLQPAAPSTSSTVICPVCNQCFSNNRALSSHMPSHPVQANNARLENLQSRITRSVSDPSSQDNEVNISLSTECDRWLSIFNNIDTGPNFNYNFFDQKVSEFLAFLSTANQRIPGPIHPAVKMYRQRKQRKSRPDDAQFSRSSNPQRTDHMKRKRANQKYDYELAQFHYSYQRRKVARKIMHQKPSNGHCNIDMNTLEQHFKSVFESPNDLCLDSYPSSDTKENINITLEQVECAIKAVNLDTSPGYDRVLIKTIRNLNVSPIIRRVTEIMLNTSTVPTKLGEGKTILIPKDGDPNAIGNWRPLTLYSVVRRVIEKVLDRHLRNQIVLNSNQRGFIAGMPGCHVNSNLVNGCLLHAKQNKSDCTVVFLDISKAFDGIGHKHIEKSLKSQGVSENLCSLIMALLSSNTVCIDIGKMRSGPIHVKKSVPQGGPLSPTLFNIAINFIYNEICDPQFANQYGYKQFFDIDALCLTGFADDQVVTSNSVSNATRVVEITRAMFGCIGLLVNPRKSMAININKGKLQPGDLLLDDGSVVNGVGHGETIKYLGCAFSGELILDHDVVDKITKYLNNIITTPLLNNTQKLNILNQYILPSLIYPLQSAPLRKIPEIVLDTLDRSIRSSVKAIIGLPTSTSSSMIYAPRRFRGLAVMCCKWESRLQHYAIAKKLSTLPDALFHRIYDCEAEMNICLSELEVEGPTAKCLRDALRMKSFISWSSQMYQGIGVEHFKMYPKANSFVAKKNTLSCSEWTAAIKLNTGYANLRGVPGVAEGQSDRLCRRCRKETETIPHVLGFCPFGNNRRISRHHSLKHKLADLLKQKGYHCILEAHAVDLDGRNRYNDIIAFDNKSDNAYIIDPTIRYESNNDVGTSVQQEKESIYAPCIPDLLLRYPQFGQRNYKVIGLWCGSRGTISSQMVNFFDEFNIDKKHLPVISEAILVDTIKMIHFHIYSD